MKTHRFRCLIWLVGCLGCAALADEAIDSPSQEVLTSYPYQPALVALPSGANVPPQIIQPEVTPAFMAQATDYRLYDSLQPVFKAEDEKSQDALYVWNLPWNTQLEVLVKPSVQPLVIPWSPMTTVSDVTFSPSSIDSSTSKLQARFPLVSLVW
jgi:hypothetical protein